MKLQITIDGRRYTVDVELIEEGEALPSEEAFYPASAASESSLPAGDIDSDPNVCRSPVNGLAIKVSVEPGQAIEAGALLLVLEAMKMETNIVAPRSATVKNVHVNPGDPVKINQVLVELE